MYRKIKRTTTLCLCCIFIICCDNKIEINEFLVFDANNIEPQCLFSTMFEEVEYLPLETKDESLIGIIQKMLYSDNRYYLLTGFDEHKLIAFDKINGKHILTINKNGKGPGEYIRVQDFWVDKDDMSIEVFSRGTRKLIRYNEQGNFINDENIEYIIRCFIKVKNDYYFEALNEKNRKALFFMQGERKSLKQLIVIDDYYINDLNNFSQFGDTISYGSSIYSYVDHFKEGKLINKYLYDFNKNKLPNELLKIHKTDNDLFIQKLKESESAYNIFSTYESSNFIVATIRYNKKMHILIYDKRTKNIIVFNNAIDDLSDFNTKFEINMNLLPLCLDNDVLIFKIEAIEFKKMLNAALNENPFLETHYNNYLKSFEANDNPILIKCKLKSF